MTTKPRPWAGNEKRQRDIVKFIMKRCAAEDVIDVAGACETIMVNVIRDRARDYQAAVEGVDALAGDMKDTLKGTLQ